MQSLKNADWSQHSCLNVFRGRSTTTFSTLAFLPEPLTEILVALFGLIFFLFIPSISKPPFGNLFNNCLLATVKSASHNFLRKTRKYSPTVGFMSKPLSYHFSKSTTQNSIHQHLNLMGTVHAQLSIPSSSLFLSHLPLPTFPFFCSLPPQCASFGVGQKQDGI